MPNSSTVVAGDDALASDYNEARLDILQLAGDYAVTTGSANAYVLALDAQIVAYTNNMLIKFQANFTNSGAATLNVNGIGAQALKYQGDTLLMGQLRSGKEYIAIYDGTDFQLFYIEEYSPYFSLSVAEPGSSTNHGVAIYSDTYDYIVMMSQPSDVQFHVLDLRAGGDKETHDITTEMGAATAIIGIAKIGIYLYVAAVDNDPTINVYRFAANDIAAGGTIMTESIGTAVVVDQMICDGENLWFNNDGGDTAASRHIWEKYIISGTTLSADGKVTCGAVDGHFEFGQIDAVGNFYSFNTGTDDFFRRYNSSGTLQATTTRITATGAMPHCFKGWPYYWRLQETTQPCWTIVTLLP